MKDRLFWIPTLIILATPIVVAVVCMVLEVRWKTWIALASGVEPVTSNEPRSSRSARRSPNRSPARHVCPGYCKLESLRSQFGG